MTLRTPPSELIYGNEPWLVAYRAWMQSLYDGPQGNYWKDRTKNELLTAFHEGYEAGVRELEGNRD
jgi:hypothetical protein